MEVFSISDSNNKSEGETLWEWECAVVDLFLNAAHSFGLPKSYGQIYGLLFYVQNLLYAFYNGFN